MIKFPLLAAAVGTFALCVGQAHAQQLISIDFNANSTYTFTATDLAGAGTANTAGWNNKTDPGGTLTGANQLNNAGTATTLSYTFTPNSNESGAYVPATLTGQPSDGNLKLFADGGRGSNNSGFPTTLSLSGVPYATYNLYLYFDADQADKRLTITLGGVSFYVAPLNTNNGTYTRGTSTVAGTYTASNYVEFTGLTGTSLTLTSTPSGTNNGSTTYNGFQIQNAVPEPSSWAGMIASLSLLVVVQKARRKHLA